MNTKKIIIALLLLAVIGLGAWAFLYNYNKNSQDIVTYETTKAFRTDIKKTAVATGEVKPRETIEIKPNITGIVGSLLAKEGQIVKKGDMIAQLKIIPDVGSLNSAKLQIKSAQISFDNQSRNFKRQKTLYQQGVISKAEYETALANYNSAVQSLNNARDTYTTAQTGVAPGLEKYSTTQIRSTINGMILDIPVEIGDNVQGIGNFSTGTTIATIANVNDMIFEGKVDEADVGKLHEGMPIDIKIGALPNKTFNGTLDFISPSGVTSNGIVEFEIKATVDVSGEDFIRAGYSANAEIVTENKKNTLVLSEADIQYSDDGDPFVEVKNGDEWKKVDVRLGLSDGENVEILKGITENDEVKIWNTDLKDKNKEEEDEPRRRRK